MRIYRIKYPDKTQLVVEWNKGNISYDYYDKTGYYCAHKSLHKTELSEDRFDIFLRDVVDHRRATVIQI